MQDCSGFRCAGFAALLHPRPLYHGYPTTLPVYLALYMSYQATEFVTLPRSPYPAPPALDPPH